MSNYLTTTVHHALFLPAGPSAIDFDSHTEYVNLGETWQQAEVGDEIHVYKDVFDFLAHRNGHVGFLDVKPRTNIMKYSDISLLPN